MIYVYVSSLTCLECFKNGAAHPSPSAHPPFGTAQAHANDISNVNLSFQTPSSALGKLLVELPKLAFLKYLVLQQAETTLASCI